MTQLASLVVVFGVLVGTVTAHVRLTWPPARTFAFDFLDNLRTQPPCGMPSTDLGPVTTLAPGQKINVTWHLAYAHRGGYKLFIIPRNGSEIVANLTTPEGWIGTNATTTIMHEVTIPDSMEGEYTLALNRNAAEWATGNANISFYTFHSCADITVTAGSVCNMKNCSGNGQCVDNVCECNELASGEFCQYVDDCMNEADCNNNGECTEVSDVSYTYPRYVCFCEDGFFGRNCEKANPSDFKVDNIAAELDTYDYKYLSPSMEVYYKVLTASNEIEVVVKTTGESWIGFGWRPNDLDGLCRNFPVTYGTGATPEGEPAGAAALSAEPATGRRRRSVRSVRIVRDTHDMDMEDEVCVPQGSGAEPEPGASAEPEAEASAEPEGEPQAPASLHPMDCMDIVIGMVHENLSRVGDYYTRDRSTPRYDSFYGGMENLVAAGGRQYPDHTRIKFRKSLTSIEQSDHSIVNGPMHLIFARGQEYGKYVHSPGSGIEACTANQRFYKRFELKYHGTDLDQRGQVANFNFYEDNRAVVPQTGPCTGSHVEPANCEGSACNYKISWIYDEISDKIQFTINAKTDMDKWTGVAFSKQGAMIGSDAVIAFRGASGGIVIEDWFLGGKSSGTVVVDTTNNLEEVSGSYVNGMMTMAFTRARDTGDSTQDVAFTDDGSGCVNFLIPTIGGTFTEGSPNVINQHAATPGATGKICIKKCQPVTVDGGNGNIVRASISTIIVTIVMVFIIKM